MKSHARKKKRDEVLELSRRLTTLSFDGDVWQETVRALLNVLGTDSALVYLPSRDHSHWSFEFLHTALASPKLQPVLDKFTEFVRSRPKSDLRWAAYDPVRPGVAQRNRALLTKDLPTPGRLTALYRKMGEEQLKPEQVRVLICDGPRLLGWVGGVSFTPLGEESQLNLQALVPALQARLKFEELSRDLEIAHASLDAVIDAYPLPCVLLGPNDRIHHMNDAARRLSPKRGTPILDGSPWESRPVMVNGIPRARLLTMRQGETGKSARLALARRDWKLTPRECTVLELVIAGLSNKQIASRLGIVEGTVELHLTHVFGKAAVDSRAELAARFWMLD